MTYAETLSRGAVYSICEGYIDKYRKERNWGYFINPVTCNEFFTKEEAEEFIDSLDKDEYKPGIGLVDYSVIETYEIGQHVYDEPYDNKDYLEDLIAEEGQ